MLQDSFLFKEQLLEQFYKQDCIHTDDNSEGMGEDKWRQSQQPKTYFPSHTTVQSPVPKNWPKLVVDSNSFSSQLLFSFFLYSIITVVLFVSIYNSSVCIILPLLVSVTYILVGLMLDGADMLDLHYSSTE